ncbi:MAG: FecR domain-containing protein [Brevinematia bacterium]
MEENKILYPEIEELLRKSKYNLGERDKISTFNNIIEALKEKKARRSFFFQKLSFALSSLAISLVAAFIFLFSTFKPQAETLQILSGTLNIQNKKILAGTTIKTKNIIYTEGEECELKLKDESLIKLFEKTEVKVNTTKERDVIFNLIRGVAFFDIKKQIDTRFIVKTPQIEISVKGTTFSVEVKSKEETTVTVLDGCIEIKNRRQAGAPLNLQQNEMITYSNGVN